MRHLRTFYLNYLFVFIGFCGFCVVPLKSCTLCNAYKTVYGTGCYLYHRLQKKINTTKNISVASFESLGSDNSRCIVGNVGGFNTVEHALHGERIKKMSSHLSPRQEEPQFIEKVNTEKHGVHESTRIQDTLNDNEGKPCNATKSTKSTSSNFRKNEGINKEERTQYLFDSSLLHGTFLNNPSALFSQLPTSTPFVGAKNNQRHSTRKNQGTGYSPIVNIDNGYSGRDTSIKNIQHLREIQLSDSGSSEPEKGLKDWSSESSIIEENLEDGKQNSFRSSDSREVCFILVRFFLHLQFI